jgi:hypothetical protein
VSDRAPTLSNPVAGGPAPGRCIALPSCMTDCARLTPGSPSGMEILAGVGRTLRGSEPLRQKSGTKRIRGLALQTAPLPVLLPEETNADDNLTL